MHAIVPHALPQPSSCCVKKRPASASSGAPRLARSSARRGVLILSQGKSRHSATQGRGTIIRSSGSRPNTSQKFQSFGQPSLRRNGLSTSGLLSSGSHAGAAAAIVLWLVAKSPVDRAPRERTPRAWGSATPRTSGPSIRFGRAVSRAARRFDRAGATR